MQNPSVNVYSANTPSCIDVEYITSNVAPERLSTVSESLSAGLCRPCHLCNIFRLFVHAALAFHDRSSNRAAHRFEHSNPRKGTPTKTHMALFRTSTLNAEDERRKYILGDADDTDGYERYPDKKEDQERGGWKI